MEIGYTFAVLGLGVALAYLIGECGRLRRRAERRREVLRWYAPFGHWKLP